MVQIPVSHSSMVKRAPDLTRRVKNDMTLQGDKILQCINAAALYDMPIRDYMIKNNLHFVPIEIVEDIASRYRDYKIVNCLYDYTDMLIMAKTNELNLPEWDYLFVDEAQDLSTLQWLLVDRMAAVTKNIIIAGDDKQSINLFAGADVDTFLTIPGKVQVLDQSYRTPRAIYNLSNGLMNRMVKYRPEGAKWKPRAVKGFVKRCKNLLPLKEMRTGEWLVLARAAFQLEHIREQLIRDCEFGALLFTINGSAPIDLDVFRVISMFKMSDIQGKEILLDAVTIKDEHTADERKQRMEYIQMFKKYISCDADRKLQPWEVTPAFVKKLSLPWAEAMDKIPTGMLRYISKVYPLYLKKGDKLFEDAQIRLMTIHASKGREATNVLLVADIPRTVSNNLRFEHDDTEIKVLYVAITRTKENLYIYTKNPKYISYEDFL